MKRIIHVNRHNIAYNKKDESVGNKKPILDMVSLNTLVGCLLKDRTARQ